MMEPAQGYMPRQMCKWLDSLDLAYQVRNMRRDLANGFIIAEIISRFHPKDISIYTYDNGNNSSKRIDNWEQIAKVLAKYDFIVKASEYEPIINQAPDSAQIFLNRLYEKLAKKKLEPIFVDAKDMKAKGKPQSILPATLLRSKPVMIIPSYAKPTASILAKDREIVRIVDEDQRKLKTNMKIYQHDEKQRAEKQDENIIEYLILKRKRQIEEEIRKQEEELVKKQMRFNKKLVNLDQSLQSQGAADVKEIQLNCFSSSTSKKAKEQQGQLMGETKGCIDFLHDACTALFKKDPIQKDIKDLKLEPKESLQNNGYSSSQQNITYTNVIQQLFLRCDEVQKKSLKALLNNFMEPVSFQIIMDGLNNNFIDFKRFFKIFLVPLEILKPTSKTFLLILQLIKNIGIKLVELEPQGTQTMFESILLKDLLNISLKYPNKRESIMSIFYLYCPTNSLSRLHLLHSIKLHIQTQLPQFMQVLACLIQVPYPSLDAELYNLFFYYAILALDSPSPLTRTNGLKVLSEVARWNYKPVLEKVERVQRLMKDSWWEVRAMGLIICANLLLFIADEEEQNARYKQVQDSTKTEKHQNQGNNQHLEEEDQALLEQLQSQSRPQSASIEQYKNQLIEILYQIFVADASQNVIRIGLIYLAPVLTKYPELCSRYLEILLAIDSKIRETVLMTNPPSGMEIGQVVSGCNSFRYQLTGAPIGWNSVGIARAMDEYVKAIQLQNFEYEHLEITLACLYNELLVEDGQVWLRIYENIKNLVFLALCEQDLCQFASEILKKFFMFESIQQQVLQNSLKIFLKLLSLIYHPDIQQSCKENLLDFFEFLNERKDKFQNYSYDIIKHFSERNKEMFLRSNLVNFMNALAKEKRKDLLGDDIY